MKRLAVPQLAAVLTAVALLSTCDKDKTVTQPEEPPPTTLASNGKLEPLPNPLGPAPQRSPAPGPGAPAPPSPTPSPSPSTSPTPTPSPTATPCATPTMSFTASGVPHTTSTNGANLDGPSVTVSGLDGCTIKAFRVKTQVTATSLTASTSSATISEAADVSVSAHTCAAAISGRDPVICAPLG